MAGACWSRGRLVSFRRTWGVLLVRAAFVSARSPRSGPPELLEMPGCIPGGASPSGEAGKAEAGHPRRGPGGLEARPKGARANEPRRRRSDRENPERYEAEERRRSYCPLPGASAKAVPDHAAVIQRPATRFCMAGAPCAQRLPSAARDMAPLESGKAIADLGAQSTPKRVVPGALLRVGHDVGLQLGELFELAEVQFDACDDGCLLHALRRAKKAVQIRERRRSRRAGPALAAPSTRRLRGQTRLNRSASFTHGRQRGRRHARLPTRPWRPAAI